MLFKNLLLFLVRKVRFDFPVVCKQNMQPFLLNLPTDKYFFSSPRRGQLQFSVWIAAESPPAFLRLSHCGCSSPSVGRSSGIAFLLWCWDSSDLIKNECTAGTFCALFGGFSSPFPRGGGSPERFADIQWTVPSLRPSLFFTEVARFTCVIVFCLGADLPRWPACADS